MKNFPPHDDIFKIKQNLKNQLCESCLCKRLNSPWTAAGQRGNRLVYGPSGGTRNEAIDRAKGSCRAEHSLFFLTLISAFPPGLSSFPFSVDCLPLQGKELYSQHFLNPTLLQYHWGVNWCFLWRKIQFSSGGLEPLRLNKSSISGPI